MNDYKECPTCKQYGWFNTNVLFDEHRCQPQWNVWDEDEADQHSTEEFRLVRAKNAASAAELCAHEMNDDGPQWRRLYVRSLGSTCPAQLFKVEWSVMYDAQPISPIA